jgi:hypothetical protein
LLRRRLRDDGGLEDRVLPDARQAASPSLPFEAADPVPGLRVLAGVRGARVFMAFTLPAAGAVIVRLHDRGPATTAGAGQEHDLGIAVGAVPPVLLEAVS